MKVSSVLGRPIPCLPRPVGPARLREYPGLVPAVPGRAARRKAGVGAQAEDLA